MQTKEIISWCLYIILFVLITLALVIAFMAYYQSLPCQGHLDLKRLDIHAEADVVADGDVKVGCSAYVDENLTCSGELHSNVFKTKQFSFQDSFDITMAGTYQLKGDISTVRIMAAFVNTIVLLLPSVESCPGLVLRILVTDQGSSNTVQLQVSGTDVFSYNGISSGTNPVYTLPRSNGNSDLLLLTNDGISVWYGIN